MTVCGYSVTPGGVYAWADSDVLRDGAVVGSMTKLGISPAGVVGIGTGFATTVGKFLDHVKGGVTISKLPTWLPSAHAAKRKHAVEYDYAYHTQSRYALVSWNRAVMFREARDFEAEELESWTSPHIRLAPRNAAEVLEVAALQLGFVRVENRESTGGTLTIAKIGSDRIARVSVPLIL